MRTRLYVRAKVTNIQDADLAKGRGVEARKNLKISSHTVLVAGADGARHAETAN